jgi:hypothetical protein
MRNTGYVAAIGLRVGSGNSHHPLARNRRAAPADDGPQLAHLAIADGG